MIMPDLKFHLTSAGLPWKILTVAKTTLNQTGKHIHVEGSKQEITVQMKVEKVRYLLSDGQERYRRRLRFFTRTPLTERHVVWPEGFDTSKVSLARPVSIVEQQGGFTEAVIWDA